MNANQRLLRVRIESHGPLTKIYNSETGEELRFVQKLEFTHDTKTLRPMALITIPAVVDDAVLDGVLATLHEEYAATASDARRASLDTLESAT